MKHILRQALIILTSCTMTPLVMAETMMLKVINEKGVTSPITVTFTKGSSQKKEKKIYRNAEFSVDSGLDQGIIQIQAKATIDGKKTEGTLTKRFQEFQNKELHIQQLKLGQFSNITIALADKKLIAPKKQKIAAHKMTDLDKEYMVEILDGVNKPLAKSKFTTNTTGPLTKSLYVRLNQNKQSGDLAKYNSNTVKVSKEDANERSARFFIIKNDDIPEGLKPHYQMWFKEKDLVEIVDPKNNSKVLKQYSMTQFTPGHQ